MRHAGTTARSIVASVVLLAATGSAAVAAAHSGAPLRAPTQQIVSAPLVEAPDCWPPGAATPRTYPGADAETIAVTVEATSLLAVDDDGRVTAAETNTGCAPRAGDHIYLVHTDGTLTEAPGYDLAGLHFRGDFTQFGYHPAVAG